MNERPLCCFFRRGVKVPQSLSLWAFACTVLLIPPGISGRAEESHPLKPADTSSPRATLKSFIDNMNDLYRLLKKKGEKDDSNRATIFKRRAIHCLDLSKIDPALLKDLGEKRAVLLTEILDRIELPPLETIPDADQVKNAKLTRWRIPDTEITLVQMKEGPRQGDFLFSSDSVARFPEFYDLVRHLPYKPGTVLQGAFEKLFTTAPPAPQKDAPLKPADTSSPQATLKSFIDNMNALYRSFKSGESDSETLHPRRDSRKRAVRCLNLSKVPPAVRDETGKETCVLLMEIFDRIEIPPSEQVPDAKNVKENNVTSWAVPYTKITIARVEEGPRKGEFLFSPETVARASEFYERVQHLPYKDGTVLKNAYQIYMRAPGPMIPTSWILGLPPWMNRILMGQVVWKWLALIGILLLLVGGLWLAFRFARRKGEGAARAPFGKRIVVPLSGILLALLAEGVVDQIRAAKDVMFVTSALFTVVIALCIAWLVALTSHALAETIAASARINSRSSEAQMVRIAFRVLSLVGFVFILLHTTANLGIPLTPVLAGLGISGVAIALAAQNSIENLIGGFNLFMDRPVRVGDFCRYGNQVGTIEEIGVRSTRVRSLDDTVVSIPNGAFSKMELENYSKRRKIWYHPRIQLAKNASPDQVRFVLVEVRKMLYGHPRVDPDPARIRFAEFGTSSLDLDVFAYVLATDYGDFLEVAEDLNLRIMDILVKGGVTLAVPARRTLLEQIAAPEPERVQETEKQVQQWREHNQLYLPSFPTEVVAELRQTLDYPPKGSPTAHAR